jgi:hypothetical protein
MSEDALERHAPLVPHLARLDADAFFALMADHTIAALPEVSRGAVARRPRR